MEKIILEISEKLLALSHEKSLVIAALDGKCGAGKTTLAEKLRGDLSCTVFHMDDFFLRPFQRTEERLNTPGGNIDYERFREEILVPLKSGAAEIIYQPYDCRSQQLLQHVTVKPNGIVLIEGSYSCHPELWDFYDLHIFLTIDPEEQLKRIAYRSGQESVRRFREEWIPLEEQYFAAYQIREHCELSF